MIAYLEGVLREKTPTSVVLDVNGVGYAVFIPVTTFYELPDEGKTVSLRIHTHVREDALQLFGFRTSVERGLFELLLRTSGVGPKLAQTILSGLAPEDLINAIRTGDVAALRAVPGVGLKTAERILLDLRDRIDAFASTEEIASPNPRAAALQANSGVEQALSALLNLGYGRSQAERAVEQAMLELGEEPEIERLIRAALRGLSR